jgi:thioredoxin 1
MKMDPQSGKKYKTKRIGGAMTHKLTKQKFLDKVFNYEQNKEWKFEGDKPCIIDFWAEWCAPCRMVGPVLEELSEEYGDKLNIYKVNTEEEQELASIFGIRSIPSLLFIPMNDKPQMAVGALPKESFVKAIEDVFEIAPVEQN